MPNEKEFALPSLKEIDALTVFPAGDGECTLLCHELLSAVEQLQGTTGITRYRLLVRIRAIRGRMHELKCKLCLPD